MYTCSCYTLTCSPSMLYQDTWYKRRSRQLSKVTHLPFCFQTNVFTNYLNCVNFIDCSICLIQMSVWKRNQSAAGTIVLFAGSTAVYVNFWEHWNCIPREHVLTTIIENHHLFQLHIQPYTLLVLNVSPIS